MPIPKVNLGPPPVRKSNVKHEEAKKEAEQLKARIKDFGNRWDVKSVAQNGNAASRDAREGAAKALCHITDHIAKHPHSKSEVRHLLSQEIDIRSFLSSLLHQQDTAAVCLPAITTLSRHVPQLVPLEGVAHALIGLLDRHKHTARTVGCAAECLRLLLPDWRFKQFWATWQASNGSAFLLSSLLTWLPTTNNEIWHASCNDIGGVPTVLTKATSMAATAASNDSSNDGKGGMQRQTYRQSSPSPDQMTAAVHLLQLQAVLAHISNAVAKEMTRQQTFLNSWMLLLTGWLAYSVQHINASGATSPAASFQSQQDEEHMYQTLGCCTDLLMMIVSPRTLTRIHQHPALLRRLISCLRLVLTRCAQVKDVATLLAATRSSSGPAAPLPLSSAAALLSCGMESVCMLATPSLWCPRFHASASDHHSTSHGAPGRRADETPPHGQALPCDQAAKNAYSATLQDCVRHAVDFIHLVLGSTSTKQHQTPCNLSTANAVATVMAVSDVSQGRRQVAASSLTVLALCVIQSDRLGEAIRRPQIVGPSASNGQQRAAACKMPIPTSTASMTHQASMHLLQPASVRVLLDCVTQVLSFHSELSHCSNISNAMNPQLVKMFELKDGRHNQAMTLLSIITAHQDRGVMHEYLSQHSVASFSATCSTALPWIMAVHDASFSSSNPSLCVHTASSQTSESSNSGASVPTAGQLPSSSSGGCNHNIGGFGDLLSRLVQLDDDVLHFLGDTAGSREMDQVGDRHRFYHNIIERWATHAYGKGDHAYHLKILRCMVATTAAAACSSCTSTHGTRNPPAPPHALVGMAVDDNDDDVVMSAAAVCWEVFFCVYKHLDGAHHHHGVNRSTCRYGRNDTYSMGASLSIPASQALVALLLCLHALSRQHTDSVLDALGSVAAHEIHHHNHHSNNHSVFGECNSSTDDTTNHNQSLQHAKCYLECLVEDVICTCLHIHPHVRHGDVPDSDSNNSCTPCFYPSCPLHGSHTSRWFEAACTCGACQQTTCRHHTAHVGGDRGHHTRKSSTTVSDSAHVKSTSVSEYGSDQGMRDRLPSSNGGGGVQEDSVDIDMAQWPNAVMPGELLRSTRWCSSHELLAGAAHQLTCACLKYQIGCLAQGLLKRLFNQCGTPDHWSQLAVMAGHIHDAALVPPSCDDALPGRVTIMIRGHEHTALQAHSIMMTRSSVLKQKVMTAVQETSNNPASISAQHEGTYDSSGISMPIITMNANVPATELRAVLDYLHVGSFSICDHSKTANHRIADPCKSVNPQILVKLAKSLDLHDLASLIKTDHLSPDALLLPTRHACSLYSSVYEHPVPAQISAGSIETCNLQCNVSMHSASREAPVSGDGDEEQNRIEPSDEQVTHHAHEHGDIDQGGSGSMFSGPSQQQQQQQQHIPSSHNSTHMHVEDLLMGSASWYESVMMQCLPRTVSVPRSQVPPFSDALLFVPQLHSQVYPSLDLSSSSNTKTRLQSESEQSSAMHHAHHDDQPCNNKQYRQPERGWLVGMHRSVVLSKATCCPVLSAACSDRWLNTAPVNTEHTPDTPKHHTTDVVALPVMVLPEVLDVAVAQCLVAYIYTGRLVFHHTLQTATSGTHSTQLQMDCTSSRTASTSVHHFDSDTVAAGHSCGGQADTECRSCCHARTCLRLEYSCRALLMDGLQDLCKQGFVSTLHGLPLPCVLTLLRDAALLDCAWAIDIILNTLEGKPGISHPESTQVHSSKGAASQGNGRSPAQTHAGRAIITSVIHCDSEDDCEASIRRSKGLQVELQGWLEKVKEIPEWLALPQGLVQATSAALSTYGMMYQAAVRAQ